MSSLRTLAALAAAALATACASPGAYTSAASPTAAVDAHAGHQPAAGSATPMSAMEPRMKAMHEMHTKMKNARTPEERSALMAEHMLAMQGGMSMMKSMHDKGGMMAMADPNATPAEKAKHHQAMAQHMAMMKMMMDMMGERMPPSAPPQ